MTESDWRIAHRDQLLEKQRHISQKLAQLRELIALVKKWKRTLAQLDDWFSGLEVSAENSKWFDMQSLVRMGSVGVQLEQMIGEFEQVGDPKTTGTGSTGQEQGSTGSTAQQRHGTVTQNLSDRAGPLASHAPWELVFQLDPEVSESVRQGELFVAGVQAVSSPFTSLGAVEYGESMMVHVEALFQEHGDEFDKLEESWKGTKESLGNISDALDGMDLTGLEQLEGQLEDTLHDYERAYDSARGEGGPSAAELRARASGSSR